MIQFLSENTFLLRSLPDRQHICPMTGDRSESALMSKLLPRLPRQSRRKDRTLYEHLFQDGRAFLVTDRVRVLVISLQGDSAEVQFLEGYHSGESGFVVREWLKFTP
jgi:hypothetical protein